MASFGSRTPDGLAEPSWDCLRIQDASTQTSSPLSFSCGQTGVIVWLFSHLFLAPSPFSLIGMSPNNAFACLITLVFAAWRTWTHNPFYHFFLQIFQMMEIVLIKSEPVSSLLVLIKSEPVPSLLVLSPQGSLKSWVKMHFGSGYIVILVILIWCY